MEVKFKDCQPQLTIAKEGPKSVCSGDDIVFTITVKNEDKSLTANNVKVTDAVPGHTVFKSADSSGSYDAGTKIVTWNIATITPGQEAVLKLTVTADGTYSGSVTNTAKLIFPPGTSTSSNEVTVTVNGKPQIDALSDQEICLADEVELEGKGLGYKTILWTTSGDGSFENANNLKAKYTPGSSDKSEGKVTLTLTLTSESGCSVSDEMEVKFKDCQPQLTIAKEGPKSVCSGDDIVFTITVKNEDKSLTANNVKVTDAVPGHTVFKSADSSGSYDAGTKIVTWNIATITPGQEAVLKLTVTADGTYSGSVTNTAKLIFPPGTSTSSNEVTVTVNSKPDCTITAPESVCLGIEGLTASTPDAGTGATYTWKVTGGTITSGQGTKQITWTSGSEGTATIEVTVKNAAGCSCYDSASVTVNSKPDCTITAPESVCLGTEGLTASTPDAGTGATYTWKVTGGTITSTEPYTNAIEWTAGPDAESVTLSVKVTNGDNCASDTCTKQVTISKPDCTITSSNTACSGATGLTASAPADLASYSWSIENGAITSATDLQTITFNAGISGITKLKVTVGNANGCSNDCEKPVEINPLPTITAQPANTVVCKGKEASFTVTATGTGTLQYQWYHGTTAVNDDERISGSATGTLTIKNLVEADAGEYHVVVTDGLCNKISDIATLTVDTGPGCITPGGSFKISGTKYEDLNGDVAKDSFDPGLSGWTIYLDANNNGVLDEGEQFRVTDAEGKYLFEELTPGTYTVREVLQTGWTQTAPVKGFADVTLTVQDPIQTVDFGNWKGPGPIPSSPLVVTKTTPAVTLIPNMETTFTITVENIGKIEIHDIKIVDELSPMLVFIPPAKYGDIVIQHTIEGDKLIFDLAPLGPLEPGNSWAITYKVKLSPEACSGASSITTLPPIITAGDTKLNVMAAASDPANILQTD